MNRKILFSGLFILLFVITNINAQLKNISNFLVAGDDAKVLAKAYTEPFGYMLGRSLNGGWYNTASVHSILGLDVTLGLNFASVLSSAKTFDVNDYLSKMNGNWILKDPTYKAPNFAGKMDNRPVLRENTTGKELELPNGIGLSLIPIPIIQAGLGLPFHTEIIGRFFPTVSLGKYGKVGLWGIGLKHDIKEDLPIIKHLPILQISALVGYTHLGMDFNIADPKKLTFNTNAFTARIIAGANLPFIAFYWGFGYGNVASEFDLKAYNEPLNDKIKNGAFDSNLGMRLKIGPLTLHGDYTFGDYSVISAGLGLTYR
jgi:hypothetical protein